VLLVNLLAALNFANVFQKIKNVRRIKDVEKLLKRDQNKKKRKKTFFSTSLWSADVKT